MMRLGTAGEAVYREHPIKILRYSAKNLWLLIFPLLRSLRFYPFSLQNLIDWGAGAWFDLLVALLILGIGTLRWHACTYYFDEVSIRSQSGILLRRGTEIPLVMSADPEKSDTAYAALPAPEDGKTYKARVSGEQILVYLSDEPQEYVLSANAASVLNVEGSAAVLTSEENATQSAQVSAANLTLQSARTSGSLSLSGMSAFRAEGSSAFSQMILDASAGLSLRLGGRLSLHGLVNNGSLSVQGSGVLEVGELSGSGSYTIDPQCNFSVEPLPDAIGGLVPTQIQILGEEKPFFTSLTVLLLPCFIVSSLKIRKYSRSPRLQNRTKSRLSGRRVTRR